jgi:hypothetical protein
MILPQITYNPPAILEDPGFELGDTVSGNFSSAWTVSAGLWTCSSARPHLGVASANFATTPVGVSYLEAAKRLTCIPGTTVTVSAWIYCNFLLTSGSGVQPRVDFFDATDTFITYAGYGAPPPPVGWSLVQTSAVAPVGAVYCRFGVVAYSIASTYGTLQVFCDDITVAGAYDSKTLDFQYPPTGKPAYSGKSDRKDTFSTAGVRQTIVMANYTQFPITMGVILDDGTDLQAWQRFLAWAQQGGGFTYNPDGENPDGALQCFMVENTGVLAFSSNGVYTFSGTFQQEITG